jgi:hypothetical protein
LLKLIDNGTATRGGQIAVHLLAYNLVRWAMATAAHLG